MASVTLDIMPKPRGRPPKPEEERKPTASIRVEADLAQMLTIITTVTKENTSDIISPLIRSAVEKRYDEMVKRLAQERKGDKRPQPE